MSSEKIAFALRPGVFSPKEIGEISTVLDKNSKVTRIFIPDVRSGFESLDVVSSILAVTTRVHAGSGVIRLLEHDPALLTRRVQTLQVFSSNRFFLGVGTGAPGPKPGKSVAALLQRLDELKKSFRAFPRGVESPETYVATLKRGIARRAVGKTDGLLLNFCSPRHANGLIAAVKPQMVSPIEFACYLKIFYSSQSDDTARRLLVQELLNYDSIPQYHEMFLQDGTADVISAFRKNEEWKRGPVELPSELLKVSRANPLGAELHRFVQSFRKAGVTLPVIYPYFPSGEKREFKVETMKQILDDLEENSVADR